MNNREESEQLPPNNAPPLGKQFYIDGPHGQRSPHGAYTVRLEDDGLPDPAPPLAQPGEDLLYGVTDTDAERQDSAKHEGRRRAGAGSAIVLVGVLALAGIGEYININGFGQKIPVVGRVFKQDGLIGNVGPTASGDSDANFLNKMGGEWSLEMLMSATKTHKNELPSGFVEETQFGLDIPESSRGEQFKPTPDNLTEDTDAVYGKTDKNGDRVDHEIKGGVVISRNPAGIDINGRFDNGEVAIEGMTTTILGLIGGAEARGGTPVADVADITEGRKQELSEVWINFIKPDSLKKDTPVVLSLRYPLDSINDGRQTNLPANPQQLIEIIENPDKFFVVSQNGEERNRATDSSKADETAEKEIKPRIVSSQELEVPISISAEALSQGVLITNTDKETGEEIRQAGSVVWIEDRPMLVTSEQAFTDGDPSTAVMSTRYGEISTKGLKKVGNTGELISETPPAMVEGSAQGGGFIAELDPTGALLRVSEDRAYAELEGALGDLMDPLDTAESLSLEEIASQPLFAAGLSESVGEGQAAAIFPTIKKDGSLLMAVLKENAPPNGSLIVNLAGVAIGVVTEVTNEPKDGLVAEDGGGFVQVKHVIF